MAPSLLSIWGDMHEWSSSIFPQHCFTSLAHLPVSSFRGRHQTLEVVQSNSVTVERAAFYLSQAVQSSPDDDAVFGPDSPAVSLACKEQAALLLLDLLAQGGELTVLKGDR